jgi:hypothetical protein
MLRPISFLQPNRAWNARAIDRRTQGRNPSMTRTSSSSSRKFHKLLSPELITALAALDAAEDLPFATLITLLINEASGGAA